MVAMAVLFCIIVVVILVLLVLLFRDPASKRSYYRCFVACSELRKVLFLAPSVCGCLVCVRNNSGTAERICAEFTSHRRRVWSLARTSSKVKVKGQGHPEQKRHFSALSAACVRFMFGERGTPPHNTSPPTKPSPTIPARFRLRH